MKKRGTKQEVFNGLAEKTNGGLGKEDLLLNKRGAIVSKKRSEQGQKNFKNIESFIHNRKGKSKQSKENVEAASKQEISSGIPLKDVQEDKSASEEEIPELKVENKESPKQSEIKQEEIKAEPAEAASTGVEVSAGKGRKGKKLGAK